MKTYIHLQHEAYLLLALSLLSVASFQSIYKEKFGLTGDIIFCSLITLWLSRYALVRWLCTLDTSTCASPTIQGVLAHFLSSHLFAGQYFDRPPPQVLAKNGIMAARVEEDGRSAFWSAFIMPNLVVAWDLVRVRLIFPLLKRREAWGATASMRKVKKATIDSVPHQTANQNASKRKGDNSASAPTAQQRMPPMVQQALFSWGKVYNAIAPMLQISVPAFTLMYYTWRLPFARYLLPFTARHRFATEFVNNSDPMQTMEQPDWSEVFFVASLPTVVSLLCFSRLINPIPDLVAGSNVLKAVRNEAKNQAGFQSKSSKSKTHKEDGPWAEQNKSIVAQNRLRLIATVSISRICENLFVSVLLPWTGYACRATGHCQEGIQLWQLSTILFPVGITSVLRDDSTSGNDFDVQADYFSAFLVFLSAILISFTLLAAQAVTLNGSYLAITGYICGEWTQVDPKTEPLLSTGTVHPSQWDPKRRYKKGDLVVVQRNLWPRQVYYKATSNSPEGTPFDIFLQATHRLFRNELGHPSTSMLLALLIQGHLIFIAFLMVVVLCNALLTGSSANGMLFTLAANAIACYGAINAGLTKRSELRQLSEAMNMKASR